MHVVDVDEDRGKVVVLLDPTTMFSVTGSALTPEVELSELAAQHGGVGYEYPFTWPALIQVIHAVKNATMTDRGKDVVARMLAERTTDLPELQSGVPEWFTPYPWQVSAAARFARVGQALLGDDMGTGKTYSAIMAINERDQAVGGMFPVVVLCPASVTSDWVTSWQKMRPGVKAVDYRKIKPTSAHQYDVIVSPYTTAIPRKGRDGKLNTTKRDGLMLGGAVVVDECHKIKNPAIETSKTAVMLGEQASAKIAMSGTPFTHGVEGLAQALKFLDAEAWPSGQRFVDRFCDVGYTPQGEPKNLTFRQDRRPEFDLCLAGAFRAVSKADAMPWLPPKVYSVRKVAMPAKWMKAYQQFESEMIASLPDDSGDMVAFDGLAQVTRLQQLASAPCDTWTTEETRENRYTGEVETYDKMHVKLKPDSWKVDELLEILDERASESQVTVFSMSKQLIDLAYDKVLAAGYTVAMYTGQQSQKEKDENKEAFQAGRVKVLLVTIQAGGTGLTLTASDCAVFLSRPYSYVDSAQCEDRQHRGGSERHESIDIIDIVTEGTIDGSIRKVLVEKAGNLSDFFKDPRIAAQVLGGTL